jgi:hypothetical protein
MKNYFLTGLLLLVIIVSCSKDSFQSKPQLTLTSVSSNVVPVNSGFQVTMRLTDKEGDFYDTIWVSKITTRCPSSNFADSLLYRIPSDAPRVSNFDGEVVVTFNYFDIQPRCVRPDTAVFSFWMKDEKGNKSDTVRTAPIIILRP